MTFECKPVDDGKAGGHLKEVLERAATAPEIVEQESVLVDPTVLVELASAMVDLLADREERLRLEDAGLARAAHISWERAPYETQEVCACPSQYIPLR